MPAKKSAGPRVPANASAREARRVEIAKGVLSQQAPGQIAARLGVSRQTVYNELGAPETQELIRAWMQPHHQALQRMIPRAMSAVNKGLKPSNEIRDRLQAVKTLGTMMEWAEGRPGDGDSNKPTRWSGTFDELLVMYRKITTEPAA